MTSTKVVVFLLLIASIGFACKTGNTNLNARTGNEPAPSETGVEKVKPAPGTGNVQGKVLYNSKPAENIEVKLCESFSRFVGGCSGQAYSARTDKDGEYVITNVPPKTYEALIAKVFDTDFYVFATSGIAGISATKYEVVADKTFFVTPTHLFKGDLKTLNPKAGSKVSAEGLELKWEPYPDAAYYKMSLFANDHMVEAPYVNQRIEVTSFAVDKPLQAGGYRLKVEAFNGDNRKLSETAEDINFTIN
jgi:hypothetical protein